MSYGPDQIDQWRGATYVDRILRGEAGRRLRYFNFILLCGSLNSDNSHLHLIVKAERVTN
jgi:hypothetical protein